MATLYIAEHIDLQTDATGKLVLVGKEPVVAEQTVAIGGGSTPSAATRSETKFVRLHTDAICSIAIGANPTATAANRRLAANQTEFFGITGGHKIAVITNS